MIQRAASTSGACRGERDSDRFGEGKERGRDKRGDEDASVESVGEGGGGGGD